MKFGILTLKWPPEIYQCDSKIKILIPLVLMATHRLEDFLFLGFLFLDMTHSC